MFPDKAVGRLVDIDRHESPTERLVGAYELKNKGWTIFISDSRWHGKSGLIRRKLKRFFEIPNFKTLKDWRFSSCIVVKDNLSLILTLSAKILRKKIIYLDATFGIPKRRLKVLSTLLNFILADHVIMFSSYQKDLWAKKFNLRSDKVSSLWYSMDLSFYPRLGLKEINDKIKILSVGRDVGRDFKTLISAAGRVECELVIVTLPYLINRDFYCDNNIKIIERIPYTELFELYSQSNVTVVPLVCGISYPSGIRAVMESMLLGVPVIAARTPVLEEYFLDGKEIIFYEPEDQDMLVESLRMLKKDRQLAIDLVDNARKKMEECYGMESYTNRLNEIIENIAYKS